MVIMNVFKNILTKKCQHLQRAFCIIHYIFNIKLELN